jgi:hypothetical protein
LIVDAISQELSASGTGTPGGSMRTAAEESRAHGHRQESIQLAKRAQEWYRSRPAATIAPFAIRVAMAQTLYVAEEWAEAGKAAAVLVREQPAHVPSLTLAAASVARVGDRALAAKYDATLATLPQGGGTLELRRAQIAALLGERDRAVQLLRDAFAHGLIMNTALHRQMDLESLRGYAPFDELMRPKG